MNQLNQNTSKRVSCLSTKYMLPLSIVRIQKGETYTLINTNRGSSNYPYRSSTMKLQLSGNRLINKRTKF